MKPIEKMAQRIVRAEIEKRQPVDAEIIEALVSRHLKVTDDGDIIVVDASGNPRVGDGPHYGSMGIEDLLNETVKTRPTLFKGTPKPVADAAKPDAGNPFAKGPGHSLSRQMYLMNTDPELAAHYEAEAGAIR